MCVSMSAATAVTKRSESKCTMASASMWVQANHARTEWRQGIKFRKRPTLNLLRPMSNSSGMKGVCVRRQTQLILLRFKIGELLFGASDVGFLSDPELKKLLL